MNRSTKSIISMLLCVAALFCLVSCKGTGSEQTAANNTPVLITETEIPAKDTEVPTVNPTAFLTEEPTPEPTETPEPTPDPNERPDPVTVEWLAAELMRRYNTGRYLTLELADYSDIMDRNEDTDLFFYDNQLWIDLEIYYRSKNESIIGFIDVSNRDSHIDQLISESETEITLDMYVTTMITNTDPQYTMSEGIQFRITVDKQRMVIIAFDQPYMCEGIYRNDLKPLAMRYRKDHQWEEADRLAYEQLYSNLETTGWF